MTSNTFDPRGRLNFFFPGCLRYCGVQSQIQKHWVGILFMLHMWLLKLKPEFNWPQSKSLLAVAFHSRIFCPGKVLTFPLNAFLGKKIWNLLDTNSHGCKWNFFFNFNGHASDKNRITRSVLNFLNLWTQPTAKFTQRPEEKSQE